MLQFLTTYRKDYTWPFVRALALRPIPAGLRYATQPDPDGPEGPNYMSYEEYQDLAEQRKQCQGEAKGLSGASGAMVPAVSTGGRAQQKQPPTPKEVTMPSNYASPCPSGTGATGTTLQHLKEIADKHPYLFNVLRSCPPDENITRVFQDRYRTTYQVDYNRETEYPNAEFDRLVDEAGKGGGALAFCPCRQSVQDNYGRTGVVANDRSRQRDECALQSVPNFNAKKGDTGDSEICVCGETTNLPRYGRKFTISKFVGVKTAGNKGSSFNPPPARTIPPAAYSTEYKDVYGKLASQIIAEKIHTGGRKQAKTSKSCL